MRKRLDWKAPQKTAYCIPTWLRDEQIKLAVARIAGRIEPGARRDEPIAVVGFGPSLNDTWQEIRAFKHVISCSGAHRFLVERGIVPSWHVEVDPRKHKVQLIGQPQKGTVYLISSTCHQALFDHLEGQDVRLWHVFDASEDGKRLLPPGEWAITGGCDAGLRALTIAAFLGFRDLHVFGLDGSARDGGKHAAEHPNALKEFAEVEYEGELYLTTSGMLEAARQVWHELNMLPAVTAKFYGQGLIQAMARGYKPAQLAETGPYENIVAFAKPELISSEYRALNTQLHRENLAFGVGGGKYAPSVEKLAKAIGSSSILDYGCGKGYLAKALPFPIWEYDPAVPGKDATPRPADLVVCTDVLEHIEPERLDFVLDDLRRCARKVGYFVIHTGPSMKKLPDGRNAHLIQENADFWSARIGAFFEVGKLIRYGPLLHFVVGPRRKKQLKAA